MTSTTTALPSTPETEVCPAWCTTNHLRVDPQIGEADACHCSDYVTFASTTDRRFRVDLGSDPGTPKVMVWVEDETGDPLDSYSIQHLPLDDAGPLIEAPHWATRTGRMEHALGSLRDAAEGFAESLLAIVNNVLTNRRLTDEQRRVILISTVDHLISEIDAVDGE